MMELVGTEWGKALDPVVTRLGAEIATALSRQRLFDSRNSTVVPEGDSATPPAVTESDRAKGKSIAETLALQALQNGLQVNSRFTEESLAGGNATQEVLHITLSMSFAFKADLNSTLLDQVSVLQRFGSDGRLPLQYRHRFPRVYAVKEDAPPYAYIMEFFGPLDGWRTVADALYVKQDPSWQPILSGVFDALEEGHEVLLPQSERGLRIEEVYLRRLEQRMVAVQAADAAFKSRSLIVNGVQCRPWGECLDDLRGRSPLDAWKAPLTSVVHGDAHLRNVLFRLRDTSSDADLKFIDPKPDFAGDYLVDAAKVCQYILGSGPIEDVLAPAQQLNVVEAEGNRRKPAELSFTRAAPLWTPNAVTLLEDWIAKCADRRNDSCWRSRFAVAMATTFLTLPALRLQRGSRDVALALYGEGLVWLNRACQTSQTSLNS